MPLPATSLLSDIHGNLLSLDCFLHVNADGITRLGRIKGKMKKRVWIREGDTLIITPWSFQDAKCDIIYRYPKPQTDWLRRNRLNQ
ncbi:MAG: translation initiation factor eIF-1A [Methanoregulaceae archaeon]|nr:translation initiation factor eIF-1A [Methanoregulaceae archaeon]